MNNEEKILEMLGTLVQKVDNMDGRLSRVEVDMTTMKSDMTTMKSDMTTMKSDMTVVKSDMTTMKSDMTTMKEDLSFTKDTAMRMELDHGEKLKALLDGYVAVSETLEEHTDILNRIDKRVSRLETRVSVHDVQLEQLAK